MLPIAYWGVQEMASKIDNCAGPGPTGPGSTRPGFGSHRGPLFDAKYKMGHVLKLIAFVVGPFGGDGQQERQLCIPQYWYGRFSISGRCRAQELHV